MSDYTDFKSGSEWRKWDLHIHTPETKKNDQFTGTTPGEKWENYISSVNASPEEISVVGITDYFCIDNYFKFKEFYKNGKFTKIFDLILPNIEIRVQPVTASATPINIHCIFNPQIDKEIETRFLSKLTFPYSGSSYSAKKEELIRLGRAMPGNSAFDEETALKAGVGQYVVSMDVFRQVFEKDPELRANTIIVVSNKSTDGASGIRKHADFFTGNASQLDATRWSIYQLSDAIFSSDPRDILYFTGYGADSKNEVIEKCSALMPCFHGCDAHDNAKIFNPDQQRFCWIKADPTFEGLKQTLYEPEDRVKIQALEPDVKNERYIISELEFIDTTDKFGSQKIYLNDNLNAIIGGKSAGKSLLLYSIAKSIDPEQVERTNKRLKFEGYTFDFDFKVSWKNAETDTLNDKDLKNKIHKITYIPQLYINHLVEKNNKEELNSLVKNILLQDAGFRTYYDQTIELIKKETLDIEGLLNTYFQIRTSAIDIVQKSKELGKSESIQKGIDGLDAAVKQGQKSSSLQAEEFETYTQLINSKALNEKELVDIQTKETVVNKFLSETIASKEALLGKVQNGILLKGQINRLLDIYSDVPADIQAIKNKIESDYELVITNLKIEIANLKLEESKKEKQESINSITEKLKPYLEKIAGQTELQKLTKQVETEKTKLLQAKDLERQLAILLKDYADTREQIVIRVKARHDKYVSIVDYINKSKNSIGAEVALKADLLYKKDNFLLYEQANKASITKDHFFNTKLFPDDLVDYSEVISLLSQPLRKPDDRLIVSDELFIPIKQKVTFEDIIKGLINDKFEIDYTVTYKGDDLLNMSPGKKGTVLLILFLQINSSEYPILIDQPEDNLDNRTIYELLCQIIKIKKKERQIIIVSHNANLVVSTDAENIIVANQEGQGTVLADGEYRFSYVNGSLEHSFAKNNTISHILLQQGIREHVCDILEGGNEAFKQREKKYSLK